MINSEIIATILSPIKRKRLLVKIREKCGLKAQPYFVPDDHIIGLNRIISNTNFNIETNQQSLCEAYIDGVYELSGVVGCQVKSYNGNIDWNADPMTKIKYPKYTTSQETLHFAKEKELDVKPIWDLGRMQALPLLAVYYSKYEEPRYIKEFESQVNSFIEQCGDCKGVQWACVMDVGIRAANLLVAYDIFTNKGGNLQLASEFRHRFIELIYKHGLFIISNLEADLLRGCNHNHYLADLCGLIYISTYLECDETRRWRKFASKELIHEVRKQFMGDGTNFENSTMYHVLSAEMCVYGLALATRTTKVPMDVYQTISKAGEFAKDIVKRNKDCLQIGDNDNGRFFKLTIETEVRHDRCFEKHLTSIPFLSALEAFVRTHEIGNTRYDSSLEYQLIKRLINSEAMVIHENRQDHQTVNKTVNSLSLPHRIENRVRLLEDDTFDLDNSSWIIYDDFGLCCYKSPSADLFVYYGNRRNWPRSHAHHDLLHFEISTPKHEYFSDPGTGWYNIQHKWRNYFRSEEQHNSPHAIGQEHINDTTFYVEKILYGELIHCDQREIIVTASNSTVTIKRTIHIEKAELVVIDESNVPIDVKICEPMYCSRGYGDVQKRMDLELSRNVQ